MWGWNGIPGSDTLLEFAEYAPKGFDTVPDPAALFSLYDAGLGIEIRFSGGSPDRRNDANLRKRNGRIQSYVAQLRDEGEDFTFLEGTASPAGLSGIGEAAPTTDIVIAYSFSGQPVDEDAFTALCKDLAYNGKNEAVTPHLRNGNREHLQTVVEKAAEHGYCMGDVLHYPDTVPEALRQVAAPDKLNGTRGTLAEQWVQHLLESAVDNHLPGKGLPDATVVPRVAVTEHGEDYGDIDVLLMAEDTETLTQVLDDAAAETDELFTWQERPFNNDPENYLEDW